MNKKQTKVFFSVYVIIILGLIAAITYMGIRQGDTQDYKHTEYRTCYGTNITKVIRHRFGVYSGHAITTSRIPIDENNYKNYTTRLFYPPRDIEYLDWTTEKQVKDWFKYIQKDSYDCYIWKKHDHNNEFIRTYIGNTHRPSDWDKQSVLHVFGLIGLCMIMGISFGLPGLLVENCDVKFNEEDDPKSEIIDIELSI